MGNRAIVKPVDRNIGVYLQWHGGRDSVEGFLKYCEMRGFRGFGQDTSYALARLSQVVGNFFGGGLDVGIVPCRGYKKEAQLDNGIYIVEGWNIVDRVWYNGKRSRGIYHEEQHEYDLQGMLEEIDSSQPVSEQFGLPYLRAPLVPTSSLKVGDRVYIADFPEGKNTVSTVVGIGEDRCVNGRNVKGIPFVARYGKGVMPYPDNINNYLFPNEIRLVKEEPSC